MTGTVLTSGLLTSSAQVSSRRSLYHGMSVHASGAGAAVVTIYNGTDNTGTVLDKITVESAATDGFHNFNRPVRATDGIYAELAADTEATVYFG